MSRLNKVNGTLRVTTRGTSLGKCAVVSCPTGGSVLSALLSIRPNGCMRSRILGDRLKSCCGSFDLLGGVGRHTVVRTHIPFRLGIG